MSSVSLEVGGEEGRGEVGTTLLTAWIARLDSRLCPMPVQQLKKHLLNE